MFPLGSLGGFHLRMIWDEELDEEMGSSGTDGSRETLQKRFAVWGHGVLPFGSEQTTKKKKINKAQCLCCVVVCVCARDHKLKKSFFALHDTYWQCNNRTNILLGNAIENLIPFAIGKCIVVFSKVPWMWFRWCSSKLKKQFSKKNFECTGSRTGPNC